MSVLTLGFRILGSTTSARRPIDWSAAFLGYAACDARAEVEQEGYLSAFCYGSEMLAKVTNHEMDVRRFTGLCWASWLWWDIDRDGNLARGQREARQLVQGICQRFSLQEGEVLVFFSGRKGFHVGLPTSLFDPQPGNQFNRIARQFAQQLADAAGVQIDAQIYDKVRPFRAPNSRHPATGLYKRQLDVSTLAELSADEIVSLAAAPSPFAVPAVKHRSEIAASDWLAAEAVVADQVRQGRRTREASALNRATLDFIRDGAANGIRATRLFSAAANLAEFKCPPALAHALLTEAALDSGLSPSEVRRQIDSGLNHQGDDDA